MASRKVGMPLSRDIPAPVEATTRPAPAVNAAARPSPSSVTAWPSSCAVDGLAADHRQQAAHLAQLVGLAGERVAVPGDQVGVEAGEEAPGAARHAGRERR